MVISRRNLQMADELNNKMIVFLSHLTTFPSKRVTAKPVLSVNSVKQTPVLSSLAKLFTHLICF